MQNDLHWSLVEAHVKNKFQDIIGNSVIKPGFLVNICEKILKKIEFQKVV